MSNCSDFQGKTTTQAFMFQNTAIDPNVIVVAFRGTSPLDTYDWQVDVDFSWYALHYVLTFLSDYYFNLNIIFKFKLCFKIR